MDMPEALDLETQYNDQYLQAELARIDLLIRHEIQRWQAAGQDPQDAFRGLAISDLDAERLSQLPFGGSWGTVGPLPEEQESAFQRARLESENHISQIADNAQKQNIHLRLLWLAQIFNLDRFELDALLICLAPALDLRYERLYGYLQDDVTRKQATVNLVLNLLDTAAIPRLKRLAYFSKASALRTYHLAEFISENQSNASNLLAQSLQVSPTVVSWLLGGYEPSAGMEKIFRLSAPEVSEADQALSSLLEPHLDFSSLLKDDWQAPILGFFGPDAAAQRAAARQCVARLQGLLLEVNLEKAKAEQIPLQSCVRLALRDALLTQAVPYFTGLESWMAGEHEGALSERQIGTGKSIGGFFPTELLAQLCSFPGLVILGAQAPWQASDSDRNKPIFWIEFPIPSYPHRRSLWEFFLTHCDWPHELAEQDITALAGQFALNGGQIRDAVSSARDTAIQANHSIRHAELFSAARLHSNSYLGGLARKVEPRYGWDDIILPGDQLELLHEIVATVHCRPQVLEEWGVGRKLVPSAGIPILFSGPPGTGKTMAAEVIANELGLDLYKIELSGIVSKYIGETEKNLEKIFDEAEHSNAILFFDEADAIFGKRSEVKDAHDRYANIEISYLLQRMELYGGVTILATNLRANLDEAFTRRLQFAIDFPFPDEEHRLRIWKALFPASIPHDLDLDFQSLARSYKLAGGNIRNIIVGAAYLASADGKVVTMDHLLHSVRRELQKMGRLVNDRDKKS